MFVAAFLECRQTEGGSARAATSSGPPAARDSSGTFDVLDDLLVEAQEELDDPPRRVECCAQLREEGTVSQGSTGAGDKRWRATSVTQQSSSTSMASHSASKGTCARTASDHETSSKTCAEVLKARGGATQVSPCLVGAAQEHTHSLFRKALQRECRQRDLEGFEVVAMVKKLAVHLHSRLHSLIF